MLKHISTTINTTVCSRVLQGVFLTVLLVVFGLAACGSGGGSTTTTNTSPTTLPTPGGIVLSLVPARTSGVAPLAVFFDASGTTDTGVTNRPFHDLEYTWSFGDPSSGTWASGAQPGVSSKNSATGPVAAHVFETPGIYTVTLTAFDGANTATTNTTITVQDPNTVFAGTNTICVSSNTTPTAGANGCPAGAQTVMQSNFATAVNTYALTNRRVLFKRGDTFTSSIAANISVTGPGTIGSYGTGALPIIKATGNNYIIQLSNQSTPTIKDWRIMDLTLDGQSGTSTNGIEGEGTIGQVIMLRLNIVNVHVGLNFSDSVLDWNNSNNHPGHIEWHELTLADSTIAHIVGGGGGYGVAVNSAYFAMLGNFVDNQLGGEGTTRFPTLVKSVISNNTLANPAPTKEVIKLHARYWCTTDPGDSGYTPTCNWTTDTPPVAVANDGINTFGYSEQIVISDNKIISAANNPWVLTIGPQGGMRDERVRNVIFERNWLIGATDTSSVVVIFARDVTARNNITDLSQTAHGGRSFLVGVWGIEPPADNVKIYNNTGYTNGPSSANYIFVEIQSAATNVTVQNNLAYAPTQSNPKLLVGTGVSGLVQSNNSTDAQIKNTFPGWVSATPAVPADFGLTAGSYANNAGATVPVWSDFFRTSRPQNGVIDMGAVEGP